MLWNEYNSYTSSGNENQGIILYGKKHEKSMQLNVFVFFFLQNGKDITWNLSAGHSELMSLHGDTKGFLNKQSVHTMLDKTLPENHFAGTCTTSRGRTVLGMDITVRAVHFYADRIKFVSPQKQLKCSTFTVTNRRPMRRHGENENHDCSSPRILREKTRR